MKRTFDPVAPPPTPTAKERLLDAAEQLFAEVGFEGASIRAITTAAGVNLAAANYHFGSKQRLLEAVFERRTRPVNKARIAALDAIEASAEDTASVPDCAAILDAFVRPLIQVGRDAEASHFRRLAGRLLNEPGELVHKILPQFHEVRRRFFEAFARALPDLDATTLSLRMQFCIGVLCHTMLNLERLPTLCCTEPSKDSAQSAGVEKGSNVEVQDEHMIRQLVAFLAQGMRAPLALLLVLACATSCKVEAPPRVPLRIVNEITPARWQAGTTDKSLVIDSREPGIAWWQDFSGPGLNQAVDEAIRQNRDLFAAAARIDAAAIEARLAGAALHPTLDASLDAQRQRQNFIGLPIPGGGDVLSTTFTSFGAALSSTWEVDLWGRIRAGKRAALASFEATRDDAFGTRLSLVGQVCKAWFAVTESQLQLELAERSVASFRNTVEVVRARFDSGQRSAVDLRFAENQVATAEAALEARQAALESLRRRLEVLLGRYPRGTIGTDGILPTVVPTVPAGMPASVLSRRPDLRSAERRVTALLARSDEARAALYPRISLAASMGTRSASFEDLVDKDFFVWNLAANLLAPLYRGGELEGRADLAEARLREALSAFWQATLVAFNEVEGGLASEAALDRQLAALERASDRVDRALELARARYARGLDDFIVVLEAQRSSFDAASRLLDAKRARLERRIDLHLALGGGFSVESPFLPAIAQSERQRKTTETNR